MRIALILLFLLSACGRPLTGPEAAYMHALQGDGFDATRARIVENPIIGLNVQRYPARPRRPAASAWPRPPRDA